MANLKIKDANGNWIGITSIQGEPGPQGPAGPKGDTGPAGANGKDGTNGKDGVTPTFEVGTVTTGEANAEMIGENNHYTLDFTFPEGGGGTPNTITYINNNSSSNPFNILENKVGTYLFSTLSYYTKIGASGSLNTSHSLDGFFNILKSFEDANEGEIFASYISADGKLYTYIKNGSSASMSVSYSNNGNIVRANNNTSISSKLTFTSKLPETSIVPTTDNQLVNKAYVDNAIASIINGDEVSY